MKIITLNELLGLTRSELLDLFDVLSDRLSELPEDSCERNALLAALENIRIVLARRKPSPHRSGFNHPAP